MIVFDRFISANDDYATTFQGGDLAAPPALEVAVVTCMDARLHPERFLGLELGDAHVIRNAGGRATEDAIRSLAVSQTMLGTREIVLIQHTGCGMQSAGDDEIASKIRAERGREPGFPLLTFSDLEENVRSDAEALARNPLIAEGTPITGAIYDVETGRLTEVIRFPA